MARIGYASIVAFPFSAKTGYATIAAFPFSARIGYASIAAFPFSARIGYAPIAAFPFSARIGYAPVVEGSSAVLSVLSQREKDRRTSVIMHRVAKSHTVGILRHGAGHRQLLCP